MIMVTTGFALLVAGLVSGGIVGVIAKLAGRSFWKWGLAGAGTGIGCVLLLLYWLLSSISHQ